MSRLSDMESSVLKRELQNDNSNKKNKNNNNTTPNASEEHYLPDEDAEWRKHVNGDGFYRIGMGNKKEGAGNERRAFSVSGEGTFKAGEKTSTIGPTLHAPVRLLCFSTSPSRILEN